jgi:hypothetical protein
VALAARGGQGRARSEESRSNTPKSGASPNRRRRGGPAGEVRHLLGAGAGVLPRQPHAELQSRRQEAADLGHGRGDEQGTAPARRRGLQGHSGRGADAAFHGALHPEQKEFIDFLVDAFNREVEGLDDVEVWIHTCWGNPNMQKVFTDESYANSMEIYLERLKGDVWTIEATENNFRNCRCSTVQEQLKKKIAVGVISHRTLQADFPT